MTQELAKSAFSAINRRDFLKASAAVGAGLVLAPTILGAEDKGGGEKELNVGLIGAGVQGKRLFYSTVKEPGVKIVGVCDISPDNQRRVINILQRYKQAPAAYDDYREMLAKEKALDAVFIATPDSFHAEQTIACLKAGKHVYCETPMAQTAADARAMVEASRQSKRVLQIGNQRRSNPRYLAALDYVTRKNACGRLVSVRGQWNVRRRFEQDWRRETPTDEATLKKYGYASMRELRNWRFFKKFSAGPIAEMGSPQLDVFNWFLGARPRAVLATGGKDYCEDAAEWPDDYHVLYEWDVTVGQDAKVGGKKAVVRGYYEILVGSNDGGTSETFIGDEGSLTISEDEDVGGILRMRESQQAAWEDDMAALLAKEREKAIDNEVADLKGLSGASFPRDGRELVEAAATALRKSWRPSARRPLPPFAPFSEAPLPFRQYPPLAWPEGKELPLHMPHIRNFFDAIRKGVPPACPPEVGYEALVTALKVNDAMEQGKRLEFKPEEFKA
jgi:predicted dehydrogenase